MLTSSEIINEACSAAKLSDWGDAGWREPLEQLIAYFNDQYGASANANPLLVSFFKNTLRTLLVNRLYIQHNLTIYPEILQVPVPRPLFIVGLARTGSTLLHRLMAQDPSCRILKYWEMLYPFFNTQVGLNHEELSMKLAQLKIKEIYAQFPGLHHIHEISAAEPEECNILMRHTFCSQHLASEWRLPGYARWLAAQDMEKSYRFYRQMLQLLWWFKPGEFMALKCPSHLLNIRTAANVFPDANFVWLHRSPYKSIPSYLDLLSVFWGDEAQNKRFIDFIFTYSIQSVTMGMTAAKEIPGQRFLHVGYKELLSDPVKMMLKIYQYFDYEVDPSMIVNIRSWLEKNPQHKHGVHKYNLEKFGLTYERIAEEFGPYLNAYDDILS